MEGDAEMSRGVTGLLAVSGGVGDVKSGGLLAGECAVYGRIWLERVEGEDGVGVEGVNWGSGGGRGGWQSGSSAVVVLVA